MDTDGGQKEKRTPSGWGGCALWAVAFVGVVIGGCAIGLVLRGDRDAAQQPKMVEAGDGWTFEVYRDPSGDPCTQLVSEDGGGDERGVVAGQCAFGAGQQYRATSFAVRDQVVVFGPVPSGVESVRLSLADGSAPTAPAQSRHGVRYFVAAVGAEVDGPAVLLDSEGRAVTLDEP